MAGVPASSALTTSLGVLAAISIVACSGSSGSVPTSDPGSRTTVAPTSAIASSARSPAVPAVSSSPATPAPRASPPAAASSGIDACALLTPAEIAQKTGLTVGDGARGQPPAGTLGACSWVAGDSKVVLSLVDTQHIETTLTALDRRSSGTDVPGIGTKARAVQNAQSLGGGLNVFVEDASGGFAVSVLAPGATRDQVVALATLVEGRPGVKA